MLHNNSGSFFQKKNQSLEKFFFLVYFLITSSLSHSHPPTLPSNIIIWPTHPPLWWRNTWMPPYCAYDLVGFFSKLSICRKKIKILFSNRLLGRPFKSGLIFFEECTIIQEARSLFSKYSKDLSIYFKYKPYLHITNWRFFFILKVRKNRKADWRAIDSSKKRMDEFDLFAVKSKKANKTNSSVRFLGESMARQSAFEINWPLTDVLL